MTCIFLFSAKRSISVWSTICSTETARTFAFALALGLIKKEDRSLVWGTVFGSGEYQARILETLSAMKSRTRMVYAQILQHSGFNGLAAGKGDEVSSAPVERDWR